MNDTERQAKLREFIEDQTKERSVIESRKMLTSERYSFKISVVGLGNLKTEFMKKMDNYRVITPNFFEIGTKAIQNIDFHLLSLPSHDFTLNVRKDHYRSSFLIMILFKKNDRNSFDTTKKYYKECQNCFSSSSIILIGLNDDLEEVTSIEGQALADELGILYYEVNLMDINTIQIMFEDITKKFFNR